MKFSETILLCPVQNAEKMKEYFENWKIRFTEFPVLIPSRLKPVLGFVSRTTGQYTWWNSVV
jgi:hypothetical protein